MRKGIVRIMPQIILDFLQFGTGKVLDVKYDAFTDSIDFLIEHDEMPEVERGNSAQPINPMYITYQDAMGHKVAIREKLR